MESGRFHPRRRASAMTTARMLTQTLAVTLMLMLALPAPSAQAARAATDDELCQVTLCMYKQTVCDRLSDSCPVCLYYDRRQDEYLCRNKQRSTLACPDEYLECPSGPLSDTSNSNSSTSSIEVTKAPSDSTGNGDGDGDGDDNGEGDTEADTSATVSPGGTTDGNGNGDGAGGPTKSPSPAEPANTKKDNEVDAGGFPAWAFAAVGIAVLSVVAVGAIVVYRRRQVARQEDANTPFEQNNYAYAKRDITPEVGGNGSARGPGAGGAGGLGAGSRMPPMQRQQMGMQQPTNHTMGSGQPQGYYGQSAPAVAAAAASAQFADQSQNSNSNRSGGGSGRGGRGPTPQQSPQLAPRSSPGAAVRGPNWGTVLDDAPVVPIQLNSQSHSARTGSGRSGGQPSDRSPQLHSQNHHLQNQQQQQQAVSPRVRDSWELNTNFGADVFGSDTNLDTNVFMSGFQDKPEPTPAPTAMETPMAMAPGSGSPARPHASPTPAAATAGPTATPTQFALVPPSDEYSGSHDSFDDLSSSRSNSAWLDTNYLNATYLQNSNDDARPSNASMGSAAPIMRHQDDDIPMMTASAHGHDPHHHVDEYPDTSYPDTSYPDTSYSAGGSGAPYALSSSSLEYPDTSYPDTSYPDTSYTDHSFRDSGHEYPDTSVTAYPDTSVTAYPDTSVTAYPDTSVTAYPDTNYRDSNHMYPDTSLSTEFVMDDDQMIVDLSRREGLEPPVRRKRGADKRAPVEEDKRDSNQYYMEL